MTIEITLKDIVQNIDFYLQFSKQTMRAKTAYKFSKILKQVVEEYNAYNEERQKLIQKYANKDENGNVIYGENNSATMSNENYANYSEEIEGLLSAAVMLNFMPLKLEELDNINFTPSQMTTLAQFVEE